MTDKWGVREIAWFDCAGGGQLVVENGYAYIGHMASPQGTSIVDVRDPKWPRCIAEVRMPAGTHSHKVRVANGVMVTNRELNAADSRGDVSGFRGGLGIYDITNPAQPREITQWHTAGKGVHRFDFDGRYVYCSPTV